MAKKNEIRLEYKDAKSAKQYTIWMEKEGDNWDVWTAWGKITDKTPDTKKRNKSPLDKENSEKEYAKVAKEKMKKGYKLVKGKLPEFLLSAKDKPVKMNTTKKKIVKSNKIESLDPHQIKLKEIAKYIKSKSVFLAAEYTGVEGCREDGVFIDKSGKEIPGYRVWFDECGRSLVWIIPKSKKKILSVLSKKEWKEKKIPYDHIFYKGDSESMGSADYYNNGKECLLEDFNGNGDMDGMGFEADDYPWMLVIGESEKNELDNDENETVEDLHFFIMFDAKGGGYEGNFSIENEEAYKKNYQSYEEVLNDIKILLK